MIKLGGGNDGLNTVVPLDQYSTLYNVRPQVVLPESSLLSLNGADEVALHPAMTGLRNLYNEGKMSVVQSVGYANQNYSHFRSTDIWMTGSDEDQTLNTGWAGRYLNYEYPNFPNEYPNATMPDPLAVELGYATSLVFQGPITSMSYAISDPQYFYELAAGLESPTPDTRAGEQLAYIRSISRQSRLYNEVVTAAYNNVTTQGLYPATGLAQQLAVVAKLIAGGLKTRLYLVHLDGFDTHDSQVVDTDHTVGEHADLLRELSDAVTAFMNDLEGST